MSNWALRVVGEFGETTADFFTGKTYVKDGEAHPCISSDMSVAKKYLSSKTAVNAKRRLLEKTGKEFEVYYAK